MTKIPYFDAHCDTLSRCLKEGQPLARNRDHLDLQRLSAYEPMGQVFALFANSAGLTEAECFCRVTAQAETFLRAKRETPVRMKNCWLSLEGAELIGCDPERLPLLKGWGVRWINLTWNHENTLAGPHTTNKGLTPAGRDFVRRTKELGILMDVSHLSDRSFWDLADLAEGPFLASHSNSRALCGHSRNLTDEMAREIIAHRGFIGINFYPAFLGEGAWLDSIAAHFEHFLELGGEDCLGTGSDFDGADLPEDVSGVEVMPRIWEALYRRNHSAALIEKLAYGNLAAFLARTGEGR